MTRRPHADRDQEALRAMVRVRPFWPSTVTVMLENMLCEVTLVNLLMSQLLPTTCQEDMVCVPSTEVLRLGGRQVLTTEQVLETLRVLVARMA
ncbi:hypothetical protein PR002_g33229 [Phytophthora rubi]|uniref:Uncharacterized protein n=2 Tax=Phytophthora rubi TaxID=129364 RepID=A0A6A3G1P9_9STRA|nr:hypothetical protein PR002_g33229 [Phytophthora rubi]